MKTLIISFAGQRNGLGTLPKYEFVNFLNKHYPNIDKQFYLDKTCLWYNSGINEQTKNIKESVEYLEEKVKEYEKVIFVGSSAGAYASILFGSLIKAENIIVLAFKPQTIIKEYYQYNDLKKIINNSTKYYIYGDTKCDKNIDQLHHISHCDNLSEFENVFITKIHGFDLRNLRDNGKLLEIFKKFI